MNTTENLLTTAEGITWTPWSNGTAVGLQASHPDGRTEYLYLVPSATAIEPGTAHAFTFHGPAGDPAADMPIKRAHLFEPVKPRTAERAAFLTDLIITAVEGGIDYWATVTDYRWYTPDLSGGTAEPGPNGTANAHASVMDAEEPEGTYHVTLDKIEIALEKLLAVPVKGFSENRREAFIRAALDNDASEIDSGDADNLFQLASFGEVIYG